MSEEKNDNQDNYSEGEKEQNREGKGTPGHWEDENEALKRKSEWRTNVAYLTKTGYKESVEWMKNLKEAHHVIETSMVLVETQKYKEAKRAWYRGKELINYTSRQLPRLEEVYNYGVANGYLKKGGKDYTSIVGLLGSVCDKLEEVVRLYNHYKDECSIESYFTEEYFSEENRAREEKEKGERKRKEEDSERRKKEGYSF